MILENRTVLDLTPYLPNKLGHLTCSRPKRSTKFPWVINSFVVPLDYSASTRYQLKKRSQKNQKCPAKLVVVVSASFFFFGSTCFLFQ